jgi:plasmid stabilization system protein ParE
MPQVVWTPSALTDIQRHYEFLELVDLDAARRAAQAIREVGDSLELNALRGTIVQAAMGLRKLKVEFGKAGFIIHYIVIEDEVLILKVYHGRENRPT